MLPQQHHETRSETLYRHARAVIASGALDKQDFAEAAIEHYHVTTPPALRTVRYKVAGIDGAAADVKKHNGVTFWKFWEGERQVRLPADLEESIVAAMPAAIRKKCLRDLAARYGMLPARIPTPGDAGSVLDLAEVMRETAELVQAASTQPTNAQEIDEVIREGTEALGAIASYLTRLELLKAESRKPLKVAK